MPKCVDCHGCVMHCQEFYCYVSGDLITDDEAYTERHCDFFLQETPELIEQDAEKHEPGY